MGKILTALRLQLHRLRLSDVVFTLAFASVGYGIGLINVPAAFIITGSLFVALSTWDFFK